MNNSDPNALSNTSKLKHLPDEKNEDKEKSGTRNIINPNPVSYSPTASKFPKEYRNILKQIGDACAHKIQVSLKQYLRINIEVFWAGMESIIFSDFINHLPSYSCIHILQTSVFQHPSLLVQNIATVSALVERILGARILDKPTFLEFTAVDIAIVSKITTMILSEIEKAFHSIVSISWRITRHETNPMLASVLPDKENVVILNFEVKGQFPIGHLQLCTATIDLLTHLEKYKKNQVSFQHKLQNELMVRQVQKIPVDVSIRLGDIVLQYQELTNLCTGDIIRLARPLSSPVYIYVEEAEKYTAKLGKFAEHWACLIEKAAGEEK